MSDPLFRHAAARERFFARMPPKPRFQTDDIVQAAFSVVRREGWPGLSARSIAKALNASTSPIYAYLSSMNAIEAAVIKKALELFHAYITAQRTGDKWIDHGLGYVLFAKEEKHLFRCINDEKHASLTRRFTRTLFAALGRDLADYGPFQGLSKEVLLDIRRSRWFMIHGLASLINNEWYSLANQEHVVMREGKNVRLEALVRDTSLAILQGHTQGND